jgi:tetratricopeptide (TPR) repeat protein
VVAASLRQAGAAAIDAGSVDAGVETLRRAAEEAVRADDSTLRGGVLLTLGSALVHSLRGYDGEGAIVLHQAIAAAREADDAPLTAEILRELAFVDVQAGRHTSADRALDEATAIAAAGDDRGLRAGLLALRGMNRADLGHHAEAVRILEESAALAVAAERPRQVAWSVGLMARSLLLAGRVRDSMRATERSIEICSHERWNAFLPWPQAVRAHGLASAGDWGAAHDQAEHAFALACEIGDPCWEGMAGRALALTALHAGNDGTAQAWIVDARARSDRVTDRYVWVSAFVALGQIEIAARCQPDLVAPLAQRLYDDAVRADLPEFIAWALTYQAADDRSLVSLAVRLAGDVTNPELSRRLEELTGPG